MNKITKEEFEVVSEVAEQTSRRNFFKKTATYSMGALAAASVVAPVTIDASEHIKANPEDDPNIMEEKPWSLKFGAPVTENLYGQPSPYEHMVTRRTTPILSSGNYRASIAVTPIQDLNGIITPNGLFFNRNHGGTPTIDPNQHRLMIHGLVEKPIVLTMDQLKRYPNVS